MSVSQLGSKLKGFVKESSRVLIVKTLEFMFWFCVHTLFLIVTHFRRKSLTRRVFHFFSLLFLHTLNSALTSDVRFFKMKLTLLRI